MTFFTCDDSFFTKLADFCRHGTAVNTEIVRKSLTIIGDCERTGFILLGLHKQVGHQLFPGGSVGCDFDFLVEHEILGCYHPKKIEDDSAVKGTGTGAADRNSAAVDKHDLAVLRSGHTDG